MKLGLAWFGNDLRCADQNILSLAANEVDQLICLYCDDPKYKRPSRYATQGMSVQRRRFLNEGLNNLAAELEALGQTLFVSRQDATTSIRLLLNELPISHVYSNHHCGWNEQQNLKHVATEFPDVHFHIEHGLTLFEPEQLPFTLVSLDTSTRAQSFPSSFSKFRKLIERLEVPQPTPKVTRLPAASALLDKLDLPSIRPWENRCSHRFSHFCWRRRSGSKPTKSLLFDQFT